jgi:hypothetical protein
MITYAARPVDQLSLDGSIIEQYRSIPQASTALGINKKHIYKSVKTGSTTHGFRFQYSDDDLPNEVWKLHPCGRKVSNLGRVCNKRGCKTFGAHRTSNYMVVYDGTKMRFVHRMVMEAFQPKTNMENLHVDHIDRDPSNNCLENLRWVTPKENAKNRRVRRKFQHCKTCLCFQ